VTPAPVALFTYNRPWHTQQTLDALKKNLLAENTNLFIFSDGPKNAGDTTKVNEVRSITRSISGFKGIEFVEKERNNGLSKSIVSGVSEIIDRFGRVIVLEDDMVTNPFFLTYMNQALETYAENPKVACIHAWVYPIDGLPDYFFLKGADCWGWATWKRAWKFYESDGKKLLSELRKLNLEKDANFNNSYDFSRMLINQVYGVSDSWAIRWYISAFLNDMLCLYPGKPFLQNIGLDSSGTNCSTTSIFKNKIQNESSFSNIDVCENHFARKKFEFFFRSIRLPFYKRLHERLIQLKKLVKNRLKYLIKNK